MPTLPEELFSLVERLILWAREKAEEAAEAIINSLAVNLPSPYPGMNEEIKELRRSLRAKAKQLGEGSQTEGLPLLKEEIAYFQWHRMLFSRFLAENNLLMHPSGVPVSLQDCAELAEEEGEADAWAVAAKYASAMLPGIFREDDPIVQVRLAPEGRTQLERILAEIPSIVFTADDSLGWMYQFWQTKKKKEVNESERKIGGADLAAVTQLFTENYMVRFLLENSLGAWWAGKHPTSSLLKEYEYLRYKDNGIPLAGIFEGWPKTAAEVTVMDPCCGSGHFLVAAFEMLRHMRMEEEGFNAAESGDAVLRDNIHGLELDLRATQIAIFSVILIAWKTGGYRKLPLLNIGCSGISVKGSSDYWLKFAGGNVRIKNALSQLYSLYENAPTFGSLIDIFNIASGNPLFTADIDELAPVLIEILKESRKIFGEVDYGIFASNIVGAIQVTKLLSKKYVLMITNIPYLARGKQDDTLKEFCDIFFPDAKNDLSTTFIRRIDKLLIEKGTMAIVSPQNWLSQTSYKELRIDLLKIRTWHIVCWLGAGAFRKISGEVVKPTLLIISKSIFKNHKMFVIDASEKNDINDKKNFIKDAKIFCENQSTQLDNPDARILSKSIVSKNLLSDYSICLQGIKTGDDSRYKKFFWEINKIKDNWRLLQGSEKSGKLFVGLNFIIDWRENGLNIARLQGLSAWGKYGIAISPVGNISSSIYLGNPFTSDISVIIPHKESDILPIYVYTESRKYKLDVADLDKNIAITNSTLVKVGFDFDYWKKVASEKYPNGLPEPYSNDPTQWLFKGDIVNSTEPLQVAISRLLGYHWYEQEKDKLDEFTDEDGIILFNPIGQKKPAADRLRRILHSAYGEEWSPRKQLDLLAEVGFTGKTLEDWLLDGFFQQHCKLFNNRPFIWHIWDGRKDGFNALVNYHKLDAGTLDKLIYTYLGSWIEIQRGHRDHGHPGADGRLVAALDLKKKLELIRAGEPPYDIYVRWKDLAEQPIGWNPDLNDGIRLNIRPFVTAGILRCKFTINWQKDRGKNSDGSDRMNDLHFTNAEKLAARQIAGK